MILTGTITIKGSTHASGGSLRDRAGWTRPRAFGIVPGIVEAKSRLVGGGETGLWSETATATIGT